ncbi:MAG: Asp23/Gls24 family envelope stress response protein [Firmicutes bacterium]|nr:Asp23/Gls24 family envelope stress response protein [Bacillota bacterium]
MSDKYVFSDEVVAVCAVNATLKTEGVFGMAGGMYDALSKNLLGRESAAKGTKVSRSGEETAVDVSVIVDYGCNIPSVAWEIQENVKNELKDMVEIDVSAVNIHVQGVGLSSEKDKDPAGGKGAGQDQTIVEVQEDSADDEK